MSKLLKAVARKHRPAIAAKMVKANGYDETRHLLSGDLHKAGIIDKTEKKDFDGCVDDLADTGSVAGSALRAAAQGRGDTAKLNDPDFVKALMALDSDTGEDGGNSDDGDDTDFPGADGVDEPNPKEVA
jgi:hypothetical protein